jgi:hypothetical protein
MPQKPKSKSKPQPSPASADLKQREYTGADGEIHHHTKKYMAEHGRERPEKED